MEVIVRRRTPTPLPLFHLDLQRFATENADRPAGSDGPKRRGSAKGKSVKTESGKSTGKGKPSSVVTPLPRQRTSRATGKGAAPVNHDTSEATPTPARRVPPRVDPEVESRTTRYIVQPGDTLHKLAHRFGTTPRELALLNALYKPVILLPGDVLLVPDHNG